MKYFLLIPVILELTFLTICLFNISHIITRYRDLKRMGRETFDAWQEALEYILPSHLARLALIEPQLYYALYLSLKRKQTSDTTTCFATRLGSYLFLVKAIIVMCLLEILAVSLLLPDRWFVWKVLHFILGIWAVVWLWADVQAMRLYPHQITSKGVKFSLGLRCCQEVPWESMRSVKRIQKSAPGFGPALTKKLREACFYRLVKNVMLKLNLTRLNLFRV